MSLASVVADRFADWGGVPFVVRDVYPNPAPEAIAADLDAFCLRHLGCAVERSEFFEASVGSVHGLRLVGGSRVVVKVHRRDTSRVFLTAMQTVQRTLAAGGFPAPEPVLGPTPLGNGVAVVESLLHAGGTADAHDPSIRSLMALGLAHLILRCKSLTGLNGLRASFLAAPRRLWPTPHDGRFDFGGTTPGAEWIDRIATQARHIRDATSDGRLIVGHGDWRVEHLRFDRREISAVYDWDSVCIEREAVLVGSVAHAFTANWAMKAWRQFPTLGESLGFIADYEAARGVPFTAMERRVARAALVYAMGYTARCEQSDVMTDFGRRPPRMVEHSIPSGSARAFLAAHAEELLETRLRGRRARA
jgi:Phosphotransferase enzyme family